MPRPKSGQKLTNRQETALHFITCYFASEGRAPTLSEIAKGLGSISITTARVHVEDLIAKGYLERRAGAGKHRNIALPGDGILRADESTINLTPRRKECFDWIVDFYDARPSKGPTMGEVGEGLGISKESASELCQALVTLGYLERYKPGKHRNLRPVVQAPRKARVLQLFREAASADLDAPTTVDVSLLFGISVWDARSILRDLVADGALVRDVDEFRLATSTEDGPRSPSQG